MAWHDHTARNPAWNDAGARIELASLRCCIAISEIYAKVTFDEQSAG